MCVSSSCAFGLCSQISKKGIHKKGLADLKEIFKSVCCDFNAILVEFDGEYDHVHPGKGNLAL